MNQGLYAAFLGMRARQRALDVTANNIANASTTGFKADRILYRSIEAAQLEANGAQTPAPAANGTAIANEGSAQQPAAAAATQPTAAAAAVPPASEDARLPARATERASGVLTSGTTDHSSGAINHTGRSLDVALDGAGFLVVQTPRGERYTRAGSLTLDAAGQLVTQRGELIVGENGPLTLPPGEVSIGEDGTVSVKGETIGRLKIVRFADQRAALTKEEATLYAATGKGSPIETTNTRVVQGALEMSNVNAVSEMAAMMQNSREFESMQRSITLLMNDLGRKVAEEIGRI